jgi:hypothetical protein
MGYSKRHGRRPEEQDSLTAHTFIINDPVVNDFIKKCEYPKNKDEVLLDEALLIDVVYPDENPVEHIIAVDSGHSVVSVQNGFPSSQITFFQFGTLLLNASDLDAMSAEPFISRESMASLKGLEREKLVLPTKNVSYEQSLTFTEGVRMSIYKYFKQDNYLGSNLLHTLHWTLFELFDTPVDTYQLSTCPYCDEPRVLLHRHLFNADFVHPCPSCRREILLTDVFRFHQVIDNEMGAREIIGYLANVIEQFNIIHIIKNAKELNPPLLQKILFIKDGPLALFGPTTTLHRPIRKLCMYLLQQYNLYLAGLEKSGAFVEHADEIKDLLKPGQAFLLNNRHIYKYIIPGNAVSPQPYGHDTYYSAKLIFKSRDSRMHVVTIPVTNENIVTNPQKSDFKNVDTILWNIEKLRCDMYDNAIVPVALTNKLISLSGRSSAFILKKFLNDGK